MYFEETSWKSYTDSHIVKEGMLPQGDWAEGISRVYNGCACHGMEPSKGWESPQDTGKEICQSK